MRLMTNILTAALTAASLCSCSGKSAAAAAADTPAFEERGAFCADSAFAYVKAQTDLGPRVPGSAAHRACSDLLAAELRRFGADTVAIVGSPVVAWDGTTLPVRNIFARFGADRPARILLLAHYDTRPWADHDPDPANRNSPIDGANDGASGVGVILEIARNIGKEAPGIGVDILLTDCEDYGAPEGKGGPDSEDTWALGARQFAENLPYAAAERPRYGILLDMVGGRSATFPHEYFSEVHASDALARVWGIAGRLGLRDRFPQTAGGAITDDHLHLIRAGIPTVDIIESANPATGSFNPTWHTLADNIDNIDPATLAAVGRVVLNTIYYEKP